MRLPVSAKAVLVDADRVLLGRNDRGEWELPGGQLEPGERIADAIRREVLEETGLQVTVGDLLLVDTFEPVAGQTVLIVAHAAFIDAHQPLRPSEEHEELAWVPLLALPDISLPTIYRDAVIKATE